ncbi:MAG: tyrosine-protein phosphatase, partial [Streptosporangiaceae bacterium]
MRATAVPLAAALAVGLTVGLVSTPAWAHGLRIEGALNVRDIGGYTGHGGTHVRRGLVLRAASLNKVTAGGLADLRRLRVATSVDFRSASEVRSDGRDRLPAGVKRVAAPVGFGLLRSFFSHPPVSFNPAATFMANSYRDLVTDKAMRTRYARTFRLLEKSRKPVLFHCTDGKDRTGVMTALVLTALGVSKKNIYRDYLRSNAELAATNKKIFAELEAENVDRRVVEPLFTVRAAYLDAWYSQIKKSYG